ncbi:MAG: N-acetyl-gamma-glutamyl-phosphate reductase, partial [Verrucomicrobiia bacterium]
HGEATPIVESLLKTGKKIIDLSADFRLKDRNRYVEYYNAQPASQTLLNLAVYGNPELYREAISQAQFIACPGCYPTSILLALAPLLKENKIKTDSIVIHSSSGVSGAGRKADLALLFAECDENVKPYSVGHHRHIPEIEQELSRVASEPVTVQFTPHLLPVRRGILTSIVVEPRDKKSLPPQQEVETWYTRFYDKKPFVRFLNRSLPEIKHVAWTNRCDIAVRVDSRTSRLLIFSALDNLTKGAGGQAIQCLNLMMDWNETEGLPR